MKPQLTFESDETIQTVRPKNGKYVCLSLDKLSGGSIFTVFETFEEAFEWFNAYVEVESVAVDMRT